MEKIQNPLDLFYKWEKEKGKEIYLHQAIAGKWHRYSWNRVGEEARRIAAALKAMNLPPKSHISIVSKNCAHWIIADLAIMMSGHVSIPLYPKLSAGTVEQILTHSHAKVIFIGKLDDWDTMKEGMPGDVVGISFPFYEEAGYLKWDDLLAKHEPISGNPTRDDDELATIVYTSGTTGKPKGVMHSFYSIGYAVHYALQALEANYDLRFFSYLPLAHIAERLLVEAGSLSGGGEVYFAESLDTFADNLQTANPTIFFGVPRIWTKFQQGILSKLPQSRLNLLLKIPGVSGMIKKRLQKALGLDKARLIASGAAPIPIAQLEWYSKLGIQIQEAYGMSENCAYSHFNRDKPLKFGFVGCAMPNAIVKLSEEQEVLMKSPCLMLGYYREPELSREALTEDGFLKTGDQGFIDKDGCLKITGRVKDMFKTEKGKYVVPSPIEMQLSRNSLIEQVCVVGTHLPQPIALMVASEAAANEQRNAIAASIRETINLINPELDAHEKIAKGILVKEAWTIENELLTPTLKIKRNAIESKYGNQFKDWYDAEEKVLFE